MLTCANSPEVSSYGGGSSCTTNLCSMALLESSIHWELLRTRGKGTVMERRSSFPGCGLLLSRCSALLVAILGESIRTSAPVWLTSDAAGLCSMACSLVTTATKVNFGGTRRGLGGTYASSATSAASCGSSSSLASDSVSSLYWILELLKGLSACEGVTSSLLRMLCTGQRDSFISGIGACY